MLLLAHAGLLKLPGPFPPSWYIHTAKRVKRPKHSLPYHALNTCCTYALIVAVALDAALTIRHRPFKRYRIAGPKLCRPSIQVLSLLPAVATSECCLRMHYLQSRRFQKPSIRQQHFAHAYGWPSFISKKGRASSPESAPPADLAPPAAPGRPSHRETPRDLRRNAGRCRPRCSSSSSLPLKHTKHTHTHIRMKTDVGLM